MAKKKLESSAPAKPAKENEGYMPDHEIDFSDAPELTDEELSRARRVGRPKSDKPTKRIMAIRMDPDLVYRLRKMAEKRHIPYQTLIHQLLEEATDDVA